MLEESSLVPYAASDLTGKRVLVLAPHPDDETIGCGGSLALHAAAGDPVKVVFLTNGARADASGTWDEEAYVALRREEAQRAAAILGISELEFWPYMDRSLAAAQGLLPRMIDLLQSFGPELVYLPSPLEFHPDHRAACFVFCEALRSCDVNCRVAFCEVGQPLRINTLVDITGVLEQKTRALETYQSQLSLRPYQEISLALNRFRALTLPRDVSHAEGFSAWNAELVRELGPLSLHLQDVEGLAPDSGSSGPLVSIIVRTKDRPLLLAEAVRSIARQSYANVEIVVVNDGGREVGEVVAAAAGTTPVRYIAHERCRGRAAAANSGLKSARGKYVGFLDDDDLIYPEHVTRLVSCLEGSDCRVAYSQCECGEYERLRHGYRLQRRWPFVTSEFDRGKLIYENYVPSMCILFEKSLCRQVGTFDEQFEIYEDWDFWIRLAGVTAFRHLPEITGQYRLIGTGSVGTTGRDYDIWKWTRRIYGKHRDLWDPENLSDYLRHTIGFRLAELRKETEGLREKLSGQDETIQSLRARSEENEDRAESLRQEVQAQEKLAVAYERQIIERDGQLRSMKATIGGLEAEVLRKEAEINKIRKTISWRVTRPLRAARELRHRPARPLQHGKELDEPYLQWIQANEPGPKDLAGMRTEAGRLGSRIRFSVVMPVHDPEKVWLQCAIESVRDQIYGNWELCIADDASRRPFVGEILKGYEARDKRIKVVFLAEHQHISGASNAALNLAQGEFVVFLDHDDVLAPQALLELAKALETTPGTDMIYSDEDRLDPQGQRTQPHFKPDWSPDLFLSQMYTGHLGCYRRELLNRIGGFRKGFEGSQDYDLVLRLIEHSQRILHIPKVLYHWRMSPNSAAGNPGAKDYADSAALRALNDHLARKGIGARAEGGLFRFTYRIRYEIPSPPLVSIVIPTRDQLPYLRRTVKGVLHKTAYRNHEVVIVNNDSRQASTLGYLRGLQRIPRLKVVECPGEFNFSAVVNLGVRNAAGAIVLLLNDDVEIVREDWLEAMVEHAQRPEVGAVGAKLVYPQHRGIQHAGIVVGIQGYAGHPHRWLPEDQPDHFSRAQLIQNVSAVTGACLMTRREVFDAVGGFDEQLRVAANDVDYCLRVREKGWRIIYTPHAKLIHHESASRGYEDNPDKIGRFEQEKRTFASRWAGILSAGDPYYSPNLTLEREDFSLRLPQTR